MLPAALLWLSRMRSAHRVDEPHVVHAACERCEAHMRQGRPALMLLQHGATDDAGRPLQLGGLGLGGQ